MSYSNSTIAKAYADGATKGYTSNKNMYIEGQTIYSYGEHFPIAHRVRDGLYLFNSDGYSHSTSKHKSYVHRELNGNNTIIEVPTEALKALIAGNISKFREIAVYQLQKTITDSESKRDRARKTYNKDYYQRLRDTAERSMTEANHLFNTL